MFNVHATRVGFNVTGQSCTPPVAYQAHAAADDDLVTFHSLDSEQTWQEGPLPTAGHLADESIALLAEPEPTPTEVLDGLVAWDADRATQQADEHAADELRAIIRRAKERLGCTINLRCTRWLNVDSDVAGFTINYSITIFQGTSLTADVDPATILIGTGLSPVAAFEDLLKRVDATYLRPAFGGWRVMDDATIIAGHDRSKAEALDLARRVAVDETYLDVLVAHQVPGVVDERTAAHASAA